MLNSIDFYKSILLHVIPVRIIVPWKILQIYPDTNQSILYHTAVFLCTVNDRLDTPAQLNAPIK